MYAARKALAIFKGPNVFMWKLLHLSVGQTDGLVTRFRRSPLFLDGAIRSEEHTSELQSLMRISYAVFCLKKKNTHKKYRISHKHVCLIVCIHQLYTIRTIAHS